MYINVTKNRYKGEIYYSVRVFETIYKGKKRINKVIKKIGNTREKDEIERLKREGWRWIMEREKDIKITLKGIKEIRMEKPIGMIKGIEKIFNEIGVREYLMTEFKDRYEEFWEEVVWHFYSIFSERQLYLITGKPKDRYYRLLDLISEKKGKIEDLIYEGLVRCGYIKGEEVKIDTTSTYFEGEGCDIAFYGYSRDRRSDRKQIIFLLSVCDNLPVFSYVYAGNKKDSRIFIDLVKDLKERVKSKRFVVICDRGFYEQGYERLLDKEGIEYIMGLPRRKGIWSDLHDIGKEEIYLDGKRLIFYENKELREELILELERVIKDIEGDLKKLTRTEIKRRYKHALKFIDLEKKRLKEKMIEKEKKVLGRCMVITNIKGKDRSQIIQMYKSLQEVERQFRKLKGEFAIRPIFHTITNRVISHIFLRVLSLLIEKILEKKIGREGIKELLDKFSYRLKTDKGEFIWSESE